MCDVSFAVRAFADCDMYNEASSDVSDFSDDVDAPGLIESDFDATGLSESDSSEDFDDPFSMGEDDGRVWMSPDGWRANLDAWRASDVVFVLENRLS